jgi:hypothetical protein
MTTQIRSRTTDSLHYRRPNGVEMNHIFCVRRLFNLIKFK